MILSERNRILFKITHVNIFLLIFSNSSQKNLNKIQKASLQEIFKKCQNNLDQKFKIKCVFSV